MMVLTCCVMVCDVVEKLNEELSNVQQISSAHSPVYTSVSIVVLLNVLPSLVTIGY